MILRRPRIAVFADMIKIVSIFIKIIFKDSKKFKAIENYVPVSLSAYLDIVTFSDFR